MHDLFYAILITYTAAKKVNISFTQLILFGRETDTGYLQPFVPLDKKVSNEGKFPSKWKYLSCTNNNFKLIQVGYG